MNITEKTALCCFVFFAMTVGVCLTLDLSIYMKMIFAALSGITAGVFISGGDE